MVTRSGGTAIFLRRRMFENYLLHADAVAEVMNSQPGFRETPITAEEVARKFDEKKDKAKYFNPAPVSADWIKNIHAARLLTDIFGELSESRVEYRKPDHSVLIAKWLLGHRTEELNEVADCLRQAFKRAQTAEIAEEETGSHPRQTVKSN
jgi:hypothetical protein